MADTVDSKSTAREGVPVQVRGPVLAKRDVMRRIGRHCFWQSGATECQPHRSLCFFKGRGRREEGERGERGIFEFCPVSLSQLQQGHCLEPGQPVGAVIFSVPFVLFALFLDMQFGQERITVVIKMIVGKRRFSYRFI